MAKRKKTKDVVAEGANQTAPEGTATPETDSALTEEIIEKSQKVVAEINDTAWTKDAVEQIQSEMESEFEKVADELVADPAIQAILDTLAPNDISEETKAAEAVVKKKPKFQAYNPDDDEMTLEDAARNMVDGFKDSWLPAIRVKAKSMGFEHKATRAQWRHVFVAWGTLSILK